MDRPPFPFVVACGRSGTTMLRVLFEQHPDVAIPPESYFPITFLRRRDRYRAGGGFDLSLLAEDLLSHERFRAWRLEEGLVHERLRGVQPIDYPEAIRRVYALYAEAHGKTRYGDKTPPFLMHVRTLAELFPESRFVHLVRDGRSVALSLREMPFAPRTTSAIAAYWAERVRRGRAAGERLGPGRYLEVRYEDLVDDPETQLKAICAFVEVDFRPEMLAYRDEELARIPLGERNRQGMAVRRPERGVRDWRTAMPRREVAVFEAAAGDKLTAFGYERAFPTPPLPARATAAAARGWARTGGRALGAFSGKLRRRSRAE